MCHVAFTQWLHDRGDVPEHRGAAIARSLGVAVDEDDKPETPAERESRLLRELGYDTTPLTEKGWKPT